MSLSLLASGTLLRDPERRTSVNGNPYAQGLLRVPAEGEDSVLLFLVAFALPATEALLAHRRGDQVAVTGRAKLRTWQDKDGGGERHGLSVVAEAILSPYQLEKRKRRVRGENVSDDADAAAELDRIARAQAAAGRAQVLTAPRTAGGLDGMPL